MGFDKGAAKGIQLGSTMGEKIWTVPSNRQIQDDVFIER
jgi:hypothetical protein